MCLIFCLSDVRQVRRCGVCRLTDHHSRRCPISNAPEILCGRNDRSSRKCSAACPVCDKNGHEVHTLRKNMRRGIVQKWACAGHNLEDMHVRMAPDPNSLRPAQRVQKKAARGNKRRLAALVPSDGTRSRTEIAQADIVDLTCLGGVAASPAVRTLHGIAAALHDDGISRPAARVLWAFAVYSAGQSSGQRSVPPPGAFAAVDVSGRQASVVAAPQKQFKKLPKYSAATRGEQRRREKEVRLGATGSGADAEVLGSASTFFEIKGKELRRAAVQYVGFPNAARDLVKVKDAFAAFFGLGKMYTGASVANKTLSCAFVCGELMACTASVQLTVPALFASMKQSIVEVRAGDEDMSRLLTDLDAKSNASAASL